MPRQHYCKFMCSLTKIIPLKPEGVQESGCAREEEEKKWDQTSVFTSWSQSKPSSRANSRNRAKRPKVLVTPWKDYKPRHFDICIRLKYVWLLLSQLFFSAKCSCRHEHHYDHLDRKLYSQSLCMPSLERKHFHLLCEDLHKPAELKGYI